MNLRMEEVLEINAALKTLEDSKNDISLRKPEIILEAASIVLKCRNFLNRQSRVSLQTLSSKKQNPGLTGMTEFGEVSINNNEEDNGEMVEKLYGFEKNRIGHYKLWKRKGGDIEFHHFWKSDIETESEDDEVTHYRIKYNESTNTLEHFGFISARKWFEIGPILLNKTIVEPIYGNKEINIGWALLIG